MDSAAGKELDVTNSPISWRGGLRGPLTSIAVGPRLHGNAKLPPMRDQPRRPRQQESESRAPPHPANEQQAPGRGTSRVATPHWPRGQEFRGGPSRHASRAADLGRRGLPANTPLGPSHRGLDTSRWNPHRQAPPQEEASRKARSGSKSSTTTKASKSSTTNKAPTSKSFPPDDDIEMLSLPPTPPYLKALLPPSSPPARSQ
ncbi:hypothetical protein N7527_003603 [Penicillium freii]|uniref:Uncharacterized protein n=1 Tax=Penicillium freii TaxID=48697 RepID=A0A101MF36_PENFR|nr:hypothetical protein N7527_003603 [Penicillium freii]KUM59215.1 hypothetical protein ACN42_g7921 [Penicillium freii]